MKETRGARTLAAKIGRLFVSIVATVVCLLAGEALLRLREPVSFHELFFQTTDVWEVETDFFSERNFMPSATLGYELKPHSPLGTNALGMVDRERRIVKDEGVYRILCVGDSTTASSGYPRLLEERLASAFPGQTIEVWNCGVPGYSLFQYIRGIKQKWLAWNPDLIIIGFCLNDFDTTPLVVRERDRLVGYFPTREVLPHISPGLLRQSALYRWLITRIMRWTGQQNHEQLRAELNAQFQVLPVFLREHNVQVIVALLGMPARPEEIGKHWLRSYRNMAAMSAAAGVPVIDTVPLFWQGDPALLREHQGDIIHFNERGSRIVADALAEGLRQEGMLSGR